MKNFARIGALMFMLLGSWASAQPNSASSPSAASGKIPDDQLLSYLPKDGAPAGTVPWLMFRQVKLVEEKKDCKTTLKPEFAKVLRDLDNKPVKLYGFVGWLQLGARADQQGGVLHFLS